MSDYFSPEIEDETIIPATFEIEIGKGCWIPDIEVELTVHYWVEDGSLDWEIIDVTLPEQTAFHYDCQKFFETACLALAKAPDKHTYIRDTLIDHIGYVPRFNEHALTQSDFL